MPPVATTGVISAVDVPVCRFYAADSLGSLSELISDDILSFKGSVRVALVGSTDLEVEGIRLHAAEELAAVKAAAQEGEWTAALLRLKSGQLSPQHTRGPL